MATKRIVILDGPSKFDLMVSLFAGDLTIDRNEILFKVSEDDHIQYNTNILINGLTREDGSSERWLFTGYFRANNKRVSGYFSTKERKGWIEVSDK